MNFISKLSFKVQSIIVIFLICCIVILVDSIVGLLTYQDKNWLLNKANDFQIQHIKIKTFNFDKLISNLGITLPKQEIRSEFKTDRTWFQRYTNKEVEREKRYGSVDRTMVFFDDRYVAWKGGVRIVKDDLESLTRQVFRLMPHIRTTDESIALVVETAIAESDGGRIVSNKFGDHGVFQIKVKTSKDLLSWLQGDHKDIYNAIMTLRNEKLSEKDNLEQNIPYACAICITEYWRKAGSQYYLHISTLEDRGKMWKSVYNTYKGYGTVEAFINRNNKYHVKSPSIVAEK